MDKILKFHENLNGKYLDEKQLEDCAKKLMGQYRIKKKDYFYQIAEIEFYYYDQNHRDIITYPRNCSKGLWFFHQSGVDLTIESTDKGEDPSFGGILIRSVKKFGSDWKYIKTICGPQKCVNELFDILNAVDNSNYCTPLLERYGFDSVEVATTQRYISFNVSTKDIEIEKGSNEKEKYQNAIKCKAEKKFKSILSVNRERECNDCDKKQKWLIASEEDNTLDLFCDYLKAKYRFYLKEIEFEKGYKAANINKNSYKYLLMS